MKGSASNQIFDESFEKTWSKFDVCFRKCLLAGAQKLGSLNRVTMNQPKLSAVAGLMFYEALEQAFDETSALEKFKKGLNIQMPRTFDEANTILSASGRAPMHAFMLLMVFIKEHPFRAFFSGRDEPLAVNTLTVFIRQGLGDALPTDVSYRISGINLDHCPGLVSSFECCPDDDEDEEKEHPKNHFWKDHDPEHDPEGGYVWIWHFG